MTTTFNFTTVGPRSPFLRLASAYGAIDDQSTSGNVLAPIGMVASLVALALVVAPLAMALGISLPGHGRFTVPGTSSAAQSAISSAYRASFAPSTNQIPNGLQEAIHHYLGPGPIGMGTAPLVRGIEPFGSHFKALAPAQGISATISNSGSIEVTSTVSKQRVSLAPTGYWAMSSNRSLSVVSKGLHVSSTNFSGSRLTQHMGSLDTWYEVTPAGLEEGFTLKVPPTKSTTALGVDIGSVAKWKVGSGGTSLIETNTQARAPITFGGLKSIDANGRVLRSYFSLVNHQVEVMVDDSGATFPVTVDPTWTTSSNPTATLTNGGGTGGDQFGWSVAMSADGTTALIGAYGVSSQQGAAYVFHVAGEGSWASSSSPTATLTNGGGTGGDQFGKSVAMSADGTTALIGAYGVSLNKGAAYVFHVAGEGSWASSSSPTATLTNGGGTSGDDFGYSIAMSSDGTTALIGAAGVSSSTGAAYVFHVAGEGSWASSSSPTATLTNSGGVSRDNFGYSVAMSADGTAAVIGAAEVSSSTGAAYVFQSGVTPPPSVTSITPTSGPTAGGTTVTITGTNLTGATAVDFGSVAATNLSCTSTECSITDPGEGSGIVDVTVTTPGGSSAKSTADQFTYLSGSSPVAVVTTSLPPATVGSPYSATLSASGGTPPYSWSVTSGSLPPGLSLSPSGKIAGTPTAGYSGACNRLLSGFTVTVADSSSPAGSASSQLCLQVINKPASVSGYWMLDWDGSVYPFGSAKPYGAPAGFAYEPPPVLPPYIAIASTPDGGGYWILSCTKGGCPVVDNFGDAGSFTLSTPTGFSSPVAIAATPDGKGYWVATADGQVLTAGDAQSYGSPFQQGLSLNKGIVSMAITPDGKGYWLLGGDGGVFTYGDATFFGSTGNIHLNAPAVGMASTSDGNGYWFVATDGGVFTYGDASFLGSMGGTPLAKPVNGMVVTPDGGGYWLVASDGGVFTFGDAGFVGSCPAAGSGCQNLSAPIVGFAAS